MSALLKILKEGLVDELVQQYPKREGDQVDLIKINLQLKSPISVLMTDGLSNYKMTVPENYRERLEYQNRNYSELFFCLPDYWDLEANDDANMQWPFEVLQKLANGLINNNTWYGAGHTISNGNPPKAISEKMKEKYFMLMDPILLADYLPEMEIEGKQVNFLAIVPVFHKELVKKNKRGYQKWREFFIKRYGNEILDDYRRNIHKRYWEFY